MTEFNTDGLVQRPKRWDQPFASQRVGASNGEQIVVGRMGDGDYQTVLAAPHFNQMEPANFSKAVSLEGIIKNDSRIRDYQQNQVIVRAGEYINSAFLVLSGNVVILPLRESPEPHAGSVKIDYANPNSVWQSLKRWFNRSRLPEVRTSINAIQEELPNDAVEKEARSRVNWKGSVVRPMVDLDKMVTAAEGDVEFLGTGKLFATGAALGRSEMGATAVAAGSVELLELRWQGLRDIGKREVGFREHIDQLYRERGLYDHLISFPLFKHLPAEKIKELCELALFEVHGEFEWQRSFHTAAQQARNDEDYNKIIEAEPTIAKEGDYPDGLLLIGHGFGRISRYVNHGHYTTGYLGVGGTFGLEELYETWQTGKSRGLSCSLRALGYTDVIRVPTVWLEKNVFDAGETEAINKALGDSPLKSYPGVGNGFKLESKKRISKPIDREFTEFLVENRFINGTEAMVIDLERCIRCDDCVTACANAHDNNPRFNRHGKSFGRYMIANACMHCEDPVCMIGCPTGAIHRSVAGPVIINDSTCIGCSSCAESCPYDNITMVQTRDSSGQPFIDQNSKPIVKASKCDLCSDTAGEPACQQACAHDALVRIDLKDIGKLADWVDR